MTTAMKETLERPQRSQRPEAYEEFAPKTSPWWAPWLVALTVASLVIGVGSYLIYGRGYFVPSMMARGQVPTIKGYYGGDEVRFQHTEASDPNVASLLTGMMDSLVATVPSLADVPPSALGTVYVFQNGVKPSGDRGPFGYQPDVFDSVPGEPTYRPLRAVNLVTWNKGVEPKVLRSADEVRRVEAAGEIVVARPGVVVNIPIVRWPTGSR